MSSKWIMAVIALFVISSLTMSASEVLGSGITSPALLDVNGIPNFQLSNAQSFSSPLGKVKGLGHITQDDKPIPTGISDSSNNLLYVADLDENNVTVINASTNEILTNIPVGQEPVQIANDSLHAREWVSNNGSNTVSVIDTATNEVEDTIQVGTNPYGLVFDSANNYVYVADYGSNSVVVINSETLEVIANITGLSGPMNFAFNPLNGDVYVTNYGSNTVSVLSGTEIIGTVTVLQNPAGIAYNPYDKDMYVCIYSDSMVVWFKGSQTSGKYSQEIPVGQGPLGIGYDAKNRFIYVANMLGNSVTVITNHKVFGSSVPVVTPRYLVYESSNTYVYVTNSTNTITYLSSVK